MKKLTIGLISTLMVLAGTTLAVDEKGCGCKGCRPCLSGDGGDGIAAPSRGLNLNQASKAKKEEAEAAEAKKQGSKGSQPPYLPQGVTIKCAPSVDGGGDPLGGLNTKRPGGGGGKGGQLCP